MPITLTDIAVRSLKAGTYFDTKTPAFGIRVGKHRKTWIIIRGKRRQRVRLGFYPDLSLSQARLKAKALLATRMTVMPPVSFEEALDIFLAVHCEQKNKPRTKMETERLLPAPLVRIGRGD